jgi:hypothetical protein
VYANSSKVRVIIILYIYEVKWIYIMGCFFFYSIFSVLIYLAF